MASFCVLCDNEDDDDDTGYDDDDDDDDGDDDDDECLFVRPGLLLQPLPLSLFNSRFGAEPYTKPCTCKALAQIVTA